MAEKALTFKKGGANVKHNNREEKFERDNIDITRSDQNIVIKKEDLKELYKNEFSQATEHYNNKPKKNGKKKTKKEQKGDYYKEIKNNKNGQKLCYELVVQIGDMNDTNCSSNPTDEIEILKKYAEDFQERYPNLKVFNAVIHLDEETPHLHLTYVPVAENCKRGISKQNSQTQAFEQIYQNETPAPKKEDAQKLFFKKERQHLKKLMLDRGITPKAEKESHGDFTVDEYKFLAMQCERDKEQILSKISKEVDFNFPKKLGSKDKFIVTSDQIEDIKKFVYAGEQNVKENEYKIKRLKEEIVVVERSRDYFKETNLSMKYKQKDLLLEELQKQLEIKNAELQNIKNTPNAALEIANKKIQELELASKNKKEQEDKKVSALKVQQEIDRAAKKRLEDKISILDKDNLKLQGDILKERTDRVNTWDYLWNVISEIAVKLFSEDFSFQEVVDRIKEDFFDKKGVISYQDHNNQKKDLIVEIVSDVADKIELDKKTVKSKENGRQ